MVRPAALCSVALFLALAGHPACVPPVAAQPAEAREAAADGPIALRPDFNAEPATTYEHAVRVIQTQMAGQAQTLEANLARRFTVRTLETTADGALVEVEIERVCLRVDPPVAPPYDFDSARPTDRDPKAKADLTRSLRALVGLKTVFRVSFDGTVVAERGAEEIADALALDPSASMAAYFDEPVLRELIHDIFVLSGPEPRAVGDTWTRTTKTEVGGNKNVPLEVSMTLRTLDKGVAEIIGSGEFKLGELKPLVRGLETKIEQQVSQFTARWSVELGRLTSMETEQTLVLDQGGDLMQIKARLSTRSRLERVDPSAAAKNEGILLPPTVIFEPAPEGAR